MESRTPDLQSDAPRRVAVIDLGTNTFNLLIADVFTRNFQNVFTIKEGVALGMGGINKGIIAPAAYQRGIDAIVRFKGICDDYGVQEIRSFGTSAMRDAENAEDFMREIEYLTGIRVNVISGEEEAVLIYQGVKWSYDFSERAIIMDIGGGSTEFIIAGPGGLEKKISLDIGVSRIFQELKLGDPLTNTDISAIEEWLQERSQAFFDHNECRVLIGASGSFETFYEMIHREKFAAGIEAREIPIEELHDILEWIITSEQSERDSHPFIIPIRRKMAPIAAVKTRWVMKKLGVQRVLVSPCSLKEGGLM